MTLSSSHEAIILFIDDKTTFFSRSRFFFQTCFSSRGCGLRTPDVHRRESLGSPAGFWPRCNPATGLPSPCDCRLSTDLYSSRYRGSLSSIPSPGLEVVGGPPRRHSWRATAASFDTWRVPLATSTPRPTWSSMPSSPTHVHPPATSSKTSKSVPKRTRSKVTFQGTFFFRHGQVNLDNFFSHLEIRDCQTS